MNILICTQVVDKNDSNLGFFHRWIEEFAAHCDFVTVVCLKRGEYSFPTNVRVLSLGKEHGSNKLLRIFRFYSYIIETRRNYDAVFVHMNAEYAVLGGWLWHKWGKRVTLWYAHQSVTTMLKSAMHFIDRVFTVAGDSFKIQSDKVRAVGHGIDTETFKPDIRESSIETRLITTGRIAGSKHLIEMLDVLDVLHSRGELFTFTVVGEPTTPEEERYEAKLKQEINKRPYNAKVHMRGGLLHDNLPKVLNLHDLFLNFATTGNMDKAGLEALATGVPVLTTNEAFKDLLHPFELYVPSNHPALIADAMQHFIGKGERDKSSVTATLRNKVVAEHSLTRLIPKILSQI